MASGITKAETDENPQAVLDVLTFHMEGPPPKIPTRASMARRFDEAMVIKRDEYTKYYSNFRKLGQGASGIVYAATDNRTGRAVALKLAPIAELKDLANELGLQSISKQPNIVECIEAYANNKEVCIVMELMNGGSLTDILSTTNPMPEPMIAYVCTKMLMGLAFIHKQFRLHRYAILDVPVTK
jgi:serine/threonine protein kinase